MNKMWGIDFDSTINDMNQHICDTLAAYHDCRLDISDINHWNFWDDHPLGKVVWGKRMYHSAKWTVGIPPRQDAIRVIHNLIDRGDKVVVISDRVKEEFDVVRKWMDLHGLSRVPLTLTNKKVSKAVIAAKIGCTSVIDDSPHWIERYTLESSIRDIYVMSYEYNVDVPSDSRIKRIDIWKQLERMEFANSYDSNTA